MPFDALYERPALGKTVAAILILLFLAPFGTIAFVIGVFGISAYQNEKRSEQYSLARAYAETFGASDGASMLSGRSPIPEWGAPFEATITTPVTAGFGDRSATLLAARYGEAECRALLATLAARCVVLKATGDDRTVTMRLELVQKQYAVRPGAWTLFFAPRDVIEVKYNERPWANASDGRVKVYESIEDGCRQPEIVSGGCNLGSLTVETLPYTDNAGKLVTLTRVRTVLAVHRNLDIKEFVSQRHGRG